MLPCPALHTHHPESSSPNACIPGLEDCLNPGLPPVLDPVVLLGWIMGLLLQASCVLSTLPLHPLPIFGI